MNAPNFLESHVCRIPAIQFLQQLRFAYLNPEEVAVERRAAAAELRLLRQQRTALDQQKRGLMQRLLTGRIRVRL